MKRHAFTYDYVCVPPDKQIGLHSHSRWELSQVLCGGGERRIGDRTEEIEEGEIILIPPNIPHVWHFSSDRCDAEGNISNISVFFENSTLDALSSFATEFTETINKITTISEAIRFTGEARARIERLLNSMREKTPERRLPMMLELLSAVATAEHSESAGKNNTLSRAQQRLEKVRIYCRCNFNRAITLSEIAAYAGMNNSSFCTFMRRHTGMTISTYINEIRLEQALYKLQNTDNPISSIAYDVGFANVTYFNRLFHAKYHTTPTATRISGKLIHHKTQNHKKESR